MGIAIMKQVDDPSVLAQLNAGESEPAKQSSAPGKMKLVADPALLQQLNASIASPLSADQQAQKQLKGMGTAEQLYTGGRHEVTNVIDAARQAFMTPTQREKFNAEREKKEALYNALRERSNLIKGGEYGTDILGVLAAPAAAVALPEAATTGGAGIALDALTGAGLGMASPVSGTDNSSYLKQKGMQALEGAGTMLGGNLVGKGAQKLVGGAAKQIPAQVKAFKSLADRYGLKITSGQQFLPHEGGAWRQTLEHGTAIAKKNQQTLQEHLASTLGVKSSRLDEATLNHAHAQISQKFDNLLKGEKVNLSNTFRKNIDAAIKAQKDKLVSPGNAAITDTLKRLRKEALSVQKGGTKVGVISPERYRDWRTQLGRASEQAFNSQNPELGYAYKDMVGHLDNAAEESLPTGKKNAWKQARSQWSALSAVRELSSKGGLISGHGEVDASKFAQVMKSRAGKEWVEHTGAGPQAQKLVDLAKLVDTFPNAFSSNLKHVQKSIPQSIKGAVGSGVGALTGGVARSKLGQKVLAGEPLAKSVKENPEALAKLMKVLNSYGIIQGGK
jgi:uncharacterized protein with GYD domain